MALLGLVIRHRWNDDDVLALVVQKADFTMSTERAGSATAIENAGVVLLVDPMSVQYLMGAEIDYKQDLNPAGK